MERIGHDKRKNEAWKVRFMTELCYELDTFIREYDGNTPVVIFGTGTYGQFVFDKLSSAGICVDCFTCNSKIRFGTKYCNVDVKAPSTVFQSDAFIVIATVDAYTKRDILHQLLEAGVKRERVIIPIEPLGVFYDKKVLEIPEFAEVEKRITLARIQNEREYFCDYFVTNELLRIAMLGKDEYSEVAKELLSDTGVEIRYIDADGEIETFDAILLTDRENFIFLEEQLMDRMGEEHIPAIDFWTVVKAS